jgi:hypothetical protein
MAEQKAIFGMTEATANAVSAMLGRAGSDGIATPSRPLGGVLFGKTKSGGLAANSSAGVWVREPTATSWTDTTVEVLAYNESSAAIAGNVKLILIPINGRWAAFEVC